MGFNLYEKTLRLFGRQSVLRTILYFNFTFPRRFGQFPGFACAEQKEAGKMPTSSCVDFVFPKYTYVYVRITLGNFFNFL